MRGRFKTAASILVPPRSTPIDTTWSLISPPHSKLFGFHEWIGQLGRGRKILLRVPGGHPAEQVEEPPRLVVGARRAGPTERLLADDGAGRFIVHVEVAGRVTKATRGVRD